MVIKTVIHKVEHRNGHWFEVKFRYDEETIRCVRSIHGARWSKTLGSWLVPIGTAAAKALKEIFSEIDCPDPACRTLLEIPEPVTETSDGKPENQAIPEDAKGGKVGFFETREFIFIKADPYNLKDRSFLASLELSRNYLDSRYWKVLNRNEVTHKLKAYFGDRLVTAFGLADEVAAFEVKRKNQSKVSAYIEGKRIKVIFGWNKDLIRFIKTMPFHAWNPDEKYWTYAYNELSLKALKDYCAQNKLDLLIDEVSVSKGITKRVWAHQDPTYRKCPSEMVDKLKNQRYSGNTVKQYISMFEEFINYFHDIAIEDLDIAHIKEFISYLVQERRISPSYQNISVNAIKFYYEKVLGKPRFVVSIDRPRHEKHLPEILTRDEVSSLISAISNLKHRFIVILLYSTGLRRGELLNLKPGDIDRDHMQIWVRGGKGKKDRYVQLGKNTLKILDEYIALYNPQEYLIEGRGEQYSATSIMEIIKSGAIKAGISKRITPHKFRHSYATHLLEDGIDIRYIQELLGHSSIRTTQIYSHVTDKTIKNIVNPIDKMNI